MPISHKLVGIRSESSHTTSQEIPASSEYRLRRPLTDNSELSLLLLALTFLPGRFQRQIFNILLIFYVSFCIGLHQRFICHVYRVAIFEVLNEWTTKFICQQLPSNRTQCLHCWWDIQESQALLTDAPNKKHNNITRKLHKINKQNVYQLYKRFFSLYKSFLLSLHNF